MNAPDPTAGASAPRASDSAEPDPAAEFAAQLRRTVDRLGTAALPRLQTVDVDGDGLSVAQRTHALAAQFVVQTNELRRATHSVGSVGSGTPSPPPVLPELRPHGASAQLAVTGRELLVAATEAANTGNPAVVAQADRLLTTAADSCLTLRRRI